MPVTVMPETDAETDLLFALHRAARAEFDHLTDPTPEHERAWRVAEAAVLAYHTASSTSTDDRFSRTQEAA